MAAVAPAPHRHATVHRLAVSRVEQLTDDAIAIKFDVPPNLREEYTFTQGQHVAISLLGTTDPLRRSYSICTPATIVGRR